MNEPNAHLTGETFQAYLEGELPGNRTARVEAHLAACRRCASELEGWRLVFSELDAIPKLEPRAGFADRVMAGLPRQPSLGQRLAARLGSRLGDRVRTALGSPLGDVSEHLTPDRIQDLLDGAFGARGRRQAHAHLEACAPCRTELEQWEGLFAALARVPLLAPSEGFQERVMEGFEASRAASPAPTPAGLAWAGDQLRTWGAWAARVGGRLVPSTAKGWAFITGVASLPALAVLAVVAAVLAHPLLTLEGLATFASWRVADLFHGLTTGALGWLIDSPVLLAAWDVATTVAGAPGFALSGLVALGTLVLASGWILYRHVIAPSLPAGHHA